MFDSALLRFLPFSPEENLSTRVGKPLRTLDDLPTRVGKLLRTLDDLPTRVGSLLRTLDDLPTRVGKLLRTLDDLPTRVGNTLRPLNDLATRVGSFPSLCPLLSYDKLILNSYLYLTFLTFYADPQNQSPVKLSTSTSR